jgi:hypothetical protein
LPLTQLYWLGQSVVEVHAACGAAVHLRLEHTRLLAHCAVAVHGDPDGKLPLPVVLVPPGVEVELFLRKK